MTTREQAEQLCVKLELVGSGAGSVLVVARGLIEAALREQQRATGEAAADIARRWGCLDKSDVEAAFSKLADALAAKAKEGG